MTTLREHAAAIIAIAEGRLGEPQHISPNVASDLRAIRARAVLVLAQVPEGARADVVPDDVGTNLAGDVTGTATANRVVRVLSEEDRARGFVRPLRFGYRHVGDRPTFPLRDLTPEEEVRYGAYGYAKVEEYPEELKRGEGRLWTKTELEPRCGGHGALTQRDAEAYARSPLSARMIHCTGCQATFQAREFVWVDPDGAVTDQRVGS